MESPQTPVLGSRATVLAPADVGGLASEGDEQPVTTVRPKRGVPEGLWLKCGGCLDTIFRKEAEAMLNVCPKCGHHWYVSARQRVAQLLDEGTFEEWDAELAPTDPLGFRDRKPYAERLVAEQRRTGLTDAVLTGTGMIRARRPPAASPTLRSSWGVWGAWSENG